MIDYHIHLWPHGERDRKPSVEELAQYVQAASSKGVKEVALTEHLFRFSQAETVLGGYFNRYPDTEMRTLMKAYWADHAKADLDLYVECVQEAKAAGLPVVLGLEVDYYEGSMDKVSELLSGYPFDVLLGSVHWIHDWPFDHVGDPKVMAYWDTVGVESAWASYTRALEELAASGAVDVLAHPDLAKVGGHRPAVPEEFYDRMAQAAQSSSLAAEVSSAGWRKPINEPYPAPELLRRFFERGVPITTASDAHGVHYVADRADDIKSYVKDVGYSDLRAFRMRKGYDVPLDG